MGHSMDVWSRPIVGHSVSDIVSSYFLAVAMPKQMNEVHRFADLFGQARPRRNISFSISL
jgi:hypothetical protein